MRNKKGVVEFLVVILILIICILCIAGLLGLRLDFAPGSHKITPTAIDNDIWGNYKVYYKTSEYTQNSQEDYYCIDKSNTELAEEMKEYIKSSKTVMVYYEKYVGWKGITSCDESPITKIEVLEGE